MNPRPETLSHTRNRIDLASTGEEMLALMGALNPICRSISGDGLRQSLGQLAAFPPLTTHEVATGTRAFDWIVPKEWNIRDAYMLPVRAGHYRCNRLAVPEPSIDIAERSDLPFDAIRHGVDALTACGLLDRAGAAAQIS